MKLKLKNSDLKALFDAMVTLTVGVKNEANTAVVVVNRLPTTAALKAARTATALGTAWSFVDKHRNELVQEYGELGGGGFYAVTPANMGAFIEAWSEALSNESEVEVETLTVKDIEAGWSRDVETGKKGPLDIGPAELGVLTTFGILAGPQPNAESNPT